MPPLVADVMKDIEAGKGGAKGAASPAIEERRTTLFFGADKWGRDVVANASFERRQQAKGNDIAQIVLAFDEALGGVMEDIVVWTVRNPALLARRHPL